MSPRLLAAACLLGACSGGGTSGGGDDDGAATDDTGTAGPPCPDTVPEQYQYSWDCKANSCDDDQRMVYHHGSGSSTDDGDIALTEQWFMFWDGGASSCVDQLSFQGHYSRQYTAEDFSCVGCEEIWDTEISLDDQGCDVSWGSTFNDEDNEDGPWAAFVMFDTHTAFGDRNPDDAMQLFMAAVNWDELEYTLANYGRGTAVPTSDEDSWPEDYTWVSTGTCYTVE